MTRVSPALLVLGMAAAAGAQTRPGGLSQLPILPLTQLDERAPSAALDRPVTVSLAQPVPIRELLQLLVRGTSLGIVEDPAVAGTFIGDLKNVTVRQALDLTLPPLGLGYTVDGTLVRVYRREPETRIFDINYLAAARTGSVTIGAQGPASAAAVATESRSDVFADLAAGVRSLLSERATFNVDRKAGIVQVTDYPERLDRVAVYLDAVADRVQRQAQIEVRVLEVELSDEKAPGVDWPTVAGQMALAGNAFQGGPRPASRLSIAGMRTNDSARLVTMLEGQGKVTVLSSPTLLTMNNEPAIVRSDAVTLSVTPQISGDAVLTLSVSPILKTSAAAESDMLARVADGETLVLAGFTRDRETRERKAVGITGGWFGRATVVTRRRVEVVVLLTPRIVSGATEQ